jgi:hypothetical protein
MVENRVEFKPSMVVCTPMRTLPNAGGGSHLEPVTIQWHRAMKMLLSPMGYNVGEIRVDGYETGVARCMAAKEALDRGMKYLMFIDADTILPQNGLQLLVYQLDNHPDYDIAAGLYTQKQDPPVPLIWNRWGEGVFWDWTLGDVLKTSIVAAGTGAMLIRVSLFERLEQTKEKPWFCTERGEGKGENADYQYEMSDDIYFCRRVVSEVEAKILVDTNCYCKHIDWKTGHEYQLRDDALPVRRLAEKLGAVVA